MLTKIIKFKKYSKKLYNNNLNIVKRLLKKYIITFKFIKVNKKIIMLVNKYN
jgi:hypothetical protein